MLRLELPTVEKNKPSAQLTYSDHGGFREQRGGIIQPVDELYIATHYGHRAVAFAKENAGFWVGIRFTYKPATEKPCPREYLPDMSNGWEHMMPRHTRIALGL